MSLDQESLSVFSQNDFELIKKLEYFGLSQFECMVYIKLVEAGKITAGELSRRLDMDRGKVYRNLTILKNIGLIETTFGCPMSYVPYPVDQGLDNVIERHLNQIETMKNIKSDIIDILKPKGTEQTSRLVGNMLTIIEGRDNIYGTICNKLKETKVDVYFYAPEKDIGRMQYTNIPKIVKQLVSYGIKIRLITSDITEKRKKFLTKEIGFTAIKSIDLQTNNRIISAKDNYTIFSSDIDDNARHDDPKDRIMVTSEKGVVNTMYSYLDNLWSKTE